MYTAPQGNPIDPNSMAALRARLRPMGIGDILDETFRLYRTNFVLFLSIVAVLEVPAQIIATLISLAAPQPLPVVPGQGLTQDQTNQFISTNLSVVGYTSIGGLVTTFAGVIIAGVLAWAVSNRYLGRTVTAGEAYRTAGGHIGTLVLASLWVGVRLVLMSLLSVIIIGIPLIIYFGVAWALLSQTVVLEGQGVGGASQRSRELVGGYWWKTLGLWLVVLLLVAIIGGIFSRILVTAVSGADYEIQRIVTGVARLIVGVLLTPIQIVALTLLFYDLKIRKEAFDLEAMVGQLSSSPASPYTSSSSSQQPL